MRATVVPIEEKVATTTCKLPQGPDQSYAAPTMKVFNTTAQQDGNRHKSGHCAQVLRLTLPHCLVLVSTPRKTGEIWMDSSRTPKIIHSTTRASGI